MRAKEAIGVEEQQAEAMVAATDTPDLQFILIGRNPGDIDHHLNIITLYLTLHNRRWP
jgi:hypothetical protein